MTAPVRLLADPLAGVLGQSLSFDRSDCRTLADVIAKVPLQNEALRPLLRIRMDGQIIDPALYRRVLPKADTYLTVVLPLHGGDNLLLTIAAVALVAGAALISGGALVPLLGSGFAAGTLGANLAAAGLSLAGSLLLQGLAAKPAAAQSGERETVGNASANNAFEPGAPLARVLGRRRVVPQMVMPPYTAVDGKNQTVTVVYGLAGPHALSEIKIGDSDITSAADIEYEIREGFAGDAPLTLVTQTVIEKATNLTLSEFRTVTEGSDGAYIDDWDANYSPVWHRIETGKGPDDVKLNFAFPQGLADLVDSSGAGVTSMRFRIRKKGDVTWVNLPEFILKGRAAGIPIRFWMDIHFVATGSMPVSHTSFPSLSYSDKTRGWYNRCDRWPVSGTAKWTASTYFTATYTHAINYVDGQQIEVYLDTTTFPQNVSYEIEMIRGFPGIHNSGNGWVGTTQTYEESGVGFYDDFYSVRTPGGNPKIPRDPDKAPSTITLVSVQSIWDEYPFDLTGQPTCLLAIKAKNRSLQNVSVLAEGYTEDWDDTDWVADQLTSNPASWYREALRSEFNAEPVPDSLINMAKLVEWHEWNTLMGHEVNLVVQGQAVSDVLSSVAQAGFARPLDRGIYDVVIDKPREQVGLVTLRNAAGFGFEKPFGRMPHALKVQLTDEEDDYKVREVIVYADGYAAVAGGGDLEASRFESVEYPGITNEAQATKRAQRDLRFGKHRSRLLSFTQDFEHLEFAVGDLVGVQTDLFGQVGGRGRVKQVLLNGGGLISGLVLDEERDFTKADADVVTRGVQIRLDDGTIANHAVTGDDTSLNAVVFATPFAMPADGGDDLIGPGTLLATGALSEVTLPAIIWDMAPGPDLTCQVVAIDYAADELYDAIEFTEFPDIAGTAVATTHNGAGTNRNIALPTGIANGDLVIIGITTDNSSGVTFTPPSGFLPVAGGATSGTVNGAAFYKFCDGTETGTITAAVSSSCSNSLAVATRISGADPATPPTATAATGTSTTPNPPSHTPAWGLAKTLWLALFGKRASGTFNSYPADYDLGQVGNTINSVQTRMAGRQAMAASEDPGSFSIGSSIAWHAMTIAIKPI